MHLGPEVILEKLPVSIGHGVTVYVRALNEGREEIIAGIKLANVLRSLWCDDSVSFGNEAFRYASSDYLQFLFAREESSEMR